MTGSRQNQETPTPTRRCVRALQGALGRGDADRGCHSCKGLKSQEVGSRWGGSLQSSKFDVKSVLQQQSLAQLQRHRIRRRQQRQHTASVHLQKHFNHKEVTQDSKTRTRTSARSKAVSTTESNTPIACRRSACICDTCEWLVIIITNNGMSWHSAKQLRLITFAHQLHHSLHKFWIFSFYHWMADARIHRGISCALDEVGEPPQNGSHWQMARSVLLHSAAEFTLTTCHEKELKFRRSSDQMIPPYGTCRLHKLRGGRREVLSCPPPTEPAPERSRNLRNHSAHAPAA